MPWQPAWITIGGVRWAGLAVAAAGFVLAARRSGTVRGPAHDAQSGGAAGASRRRRRACLVAQSDVSGADDHLRGPGARPRRSLAVDLGRAALGRHELGRDPLRGSAPQRNIRPRLRSTIVEGFGAGFEGRRGSSATIPARRARPRRAMPRGRAQTSARLRRGMPSRRAATIRSRPCRRGCASPCRPERP